MHDDTSPLDAKLSALRGYLARGWQVIPLHNITADGTCSCGNPRQDPEHDYKQGGKHPRAAGWQNAGITTTGFAEKIWRNNPAMNIGILTGAPSGFWVLDIDPENGGDVAFEALLAMNGALSWDRYRHMTGSGGVQIFFAMPPDFEPTNSKGRLPAGIDVRGTGGQVVAPPSVSGKGIYILIPCDHPEPIRQAWPWLLDLVRPLGPAPRPPRPDGDYLTLTSPADPDRLVAYAQAAVLSDLRKLADAQRGARGTTAHKVACNLIEFLNTPWARLEPYQVYDRFMEAAARAADAGGKFTTQEAESAWRSAQRTVGGQQRDIPPDLEGAAILTVPGLASAVPPFTLGAQPGTPGVLIDARQSKTANGSSMAVIPSQRLPILIPAGTELGASVVDTWLQGTSFAGASGRTSTNETLPPVPLGAGLRPRTEREGLNVGNPAIAADWLREEAGQGKLSGLFRRGEAGTVVHTPVIGEHGYADLRGAGDDGPAQVHPLDAKGLAARVQYTWHCYRERDAKETDEEFEIRRHDDGTQSNVVRSPAMFPLEAARTALAASDMLPHLRRLVGVVHTPTIRKDGTLLDAPGYDPATRLLYLPEPGLHIPPVSPDPTPDDVTAARDLLLYMIEGFPFVSDHDRAAYLGLLLTPLLRDLTPSPYKMFAISAHQAGSGKTLLATVARLIHGGVFRAEMPEDDAELRKQITTILNMTTGPVVNIDNVTGVVRSSTLAGLLTSAAWDDRKLGANELARCVNDRVWVLTGNNMTLGGDLVRRTIWVTIDPGRPDPQLRQNFKIINLEAWVREHRGELLHALLTLARAWVAQGRPGERFSSDSYADWLQAVNGILGLAGVPGRCDAPEARPQDEGSDDQDWGAFLAALDRTFGAASFTAKEALRRVRPANVMTMPGGVVEQAAPIGLDELPGELAEKLSRAAVGSGPEILGKSLGRWLMNRRGRWSGGMTVRPEGGKTRDGQRWVIERSFDVS
jgi:hypothetical protein